MELMAEQSNGGVVEVLKEEENTFAEVVPKLVSKGLDPLERRNTLFYEF